MGFTVNIYGTCQRDYAPAGLKFLKYHTKFVHVLKPINEFLEVRFKYISSARSNELRRISSAKSGENDLRAMSGVSSPSLCRAFTPFWVYVGFFEQK